MQLQQQQSKDDDIDFLSNGFKCRRNFANNQGSGLYFAWALNNHLNLLMHDRRI